MSHMFTAENIGRDFLAKSLGGLSSRGPPSLLHNGTGHPNIGSQVRNSVILVYLFSFVLY